MFIIKKQTPFSTSYLSVSEGQNSTSYIITKDENLATEFKSEDDASRALKRSGYNGVVGLKIIEI